MELKDYIQIGDNLVKVKEYKNGQPIIECTTEEIKHPDGRVDVKIHVPCLKIEAKKE